MRILLYLLLAPLFVFGQGEQLYADGTATDQDGNSFEWITYGTQDWSIENAEVVTYRDGTEIPQVTDDTAWANLTTGAWCYYNNDSSKGKLYNWYAVMGIHDTDPNTPNKEFAPEGWHVPTDAEWTTLENYLIANGYNYISTASGNVIAKSMASTTGWAAKGSEQTGDPGFDQSLNNTSGFNAFPLGTRVGDRLNNSGFFRDNEGDNTIFSCSSDATPTESPGWDGYRWAFVRILFRSQANLYRTYSESGDGLSVRLVRDAVDTEPPVITLLGANPLEINQGTTYNEPGATATDNVDGNSITAVISGNVDTSIPDTYTMYYDAVDTASNTAIQVTRTVTVKDTEAPVITVTPPNPDTVNQGAVYNDPGATATDNGSSIGPVVASPTNLDTSNAGPATITYTISDAEGNSATATRTVNVLDTEPPVITILGSNPASVNQGATYTDEGATAFDNVDGNISSNIVVTNTVDTTTAGTYTVTYTVSDAAGNAATPQVRTVNVLDTEPPVIALLGANPIEINQGTTYNEPGATATDNVDGTIPVVIYGNVDTSVPGTYTMYYNAVDSAGNAATPQVRTVNVLDTEPPVITLIGPSEVEVNQGATYTDAGATATDNVDGVLTIVVSGSVDTNIPGTYTVTYSVTDSAGNTSTATRTVNVIENPTVYAGPDQTICENETVTLGAATASNYSSLVWYTSGSGTFINVSTLTPTYTPSAADVANGAVTLTLRANGTNGQQASDTVELSFTRQPIVDAGIDLTICATNGDVFTINDANNTLHFGTLIWSFQAGAGAIVNGNTKNPTIIFSQADVQNGFIELLLTVTPVAPCATGNVTDVKRINISNDAVEFDQNVLDDIKSGLAYCSDTKSIDLLPTLGPSVISNTNNIRSFIWYYAVDNDQDGIVDAADIDQNPGGGDSDGDGIIDAADVDFTAGIDGNSDGVDDAYLDGNNLPNNAFKLFGSGPKIENLSNGIYKVSIETSSNCTILEDFTVTTTELNLELVTEDVSCGNLGSIAIESIEPVGAYDVYWHNISDNDLDGVIDVYQQLPNSDATSTDIIPDKIDIDQNAGLGDNDGDGIIDAADVDYTGGTDTLIPGIDDDYLLENILRLNSFNNLFSISNLNAGNYRLIIENSGQNVCVLTKDITILSENEISLTSENSLQTMCEGVEIDPITYALAGAVNDVTVTGLPNGITYTVNAGVVAISGIPTDNISTSQVYTYTLTSIGSCAPTQQGVITIEPNHEIQLTSNNAQQTVDKGTPISPINFSTGGGATEATISGLPTGIYVVLELGVITIAGTPTDDITTQTAYVYTVTTTGNGCTAPTYSGTITVNPVEINPTETGILLNGTVSAENNQIKNVADPTDSQDAATKAYADAIVASRGLMNFSGWDNYQVWNDNTTVNLTPNSFVFLNADNTTLVLPDNPENCCFGDVIYVYVMRNANSIRPTTLKSNNLVIRDRNGNQAFPGSISGIFQGGGGLQMIVNVGDYWMAGSFQKIDD